MAVRIEAHAEPLPGYTLLDRLGGGGFGEVWRCVAPGGLHKAMKFVYGNLEVAGDNGHRAEQELKALSRVKTVRHPYILSLERFDIIDGQLIIVMELADRNLWDRYKECRSQGHQGIPRNELLSYMEETAEALDLMNVQYQLQHLDIKPQNLFLVYQHVKVADFGLVKDLEGMQASVTGGITPVYAAPETFDGWVSRFSDQYSLAIVYQELLTGQRPFSGTNVRQLILQHLQAQPNLSPLPPGERKIIERALAKTPDDRFPSCREMVQALREVLPGQGSKTSIPVLTGAGPPSPAAGWNRADQETPSHITPGTKTAITPVVVCQSSDPNPAMTQSIRGREPPAPVPEPRVGGIVASEIHGDGALMPTLVVGLGGTGLLLLQHLREKLCQQFGSLDALSHLRLLQIDTDPAAARLATGAGSREQALLPADLLHVGLNRPSYYIKGREGKSGLENWFNPRMLYRIPRDQQTTGIRALGRLAFWDHYRTITRRIQAELEATLNPQALTQAAQQTGLGVRTNRPRVYLLTGLAGGTGSGMFLDLAYLIRWQLRLLGYNQPDLTGVLLVPAADGKGSRHPATRDGSRVLGLGNACAALIELFHYTSPDTVFRAKYLDREPPITDPEPPFARTVLVPLPEETDTKGTQEAVGMTGEFLCRDLASLVGRAADLGRADLPAPPWAVRGQYFQTFGLYRLTVPRRELITRAARRICHRLVGHWMSRDSAPVERAVARWIQDQWRQLEMGPEHCIERLKDHCHTTLGRDPETAFTHAIDRVCDDGQTSINLDSLADAIRRLEQLLGKPSDELHENQGIVAKALKQAATKAASEWSQRLAEMPVQMIEEPDYRLAGAEECIRKVIARIEKVLEHHEPLSKQLLDRAGETCARIASLLQGDERALKKIATAEVAGLLLSYAKARYHGMILGQVAGVYVSLRGHLSDTLREINFCRTRLQELRTVLEEGDPELAAESADPDLPRPRPPRYDPLAGYGRLLYGAGCTSMSEALQHTVTQVNDEALGDLDREVQKVLKQDFTALVHVCLTTAHVTRAVAGTMRKVAESWLDLRLEKTEAAEQFINQSADPGVVSAEIHSLFEEAKPEMNPGRLAGPKLGELCLLAAPNTDAGRSLKELSKSAMTSGELLTTTIPDDVVVYREWSNLPLAGLDLLGPVGREPYQQLVATDNFTPHSRIDVEFVAPPTRPGEG